MSRWSVRNPEAMDEIADMPARYAQDALREAIGYDPDRIRDEQKERRLENWVRCDNCGAECLPAVDDPHCALCGHSLEGDE